MSLSAFPAKRRPLLLALLPVFVPALLLGACSSDDDDSPEQPLVIPAALVYSAGLSASMGNS